MYVKNYFIKKSTYLKVDSLGEHSVVLVELIPYQSWLSGLLCPMFCAVFYSRKPKKEETKVTILSFKCGVGSDVPTDPQRYVEELSV